MSTLKSLEGDTAKLARTTTQNLGSTVFDISLVYFSIFPLYIVWVVSLVT